MDQVRSLVEKAHAKRAELKIKIRQPLANARVKSEISQELADILKDEINVKEIIIDKTINDDIMININITPELKEEGLLRDAVRAIQDFRKKSGLKPDDKIVLTFGTDSAELKKVLTKFSDQIKTETNLTDIKEAVNESAIKTDIDGKEVAFGAVK